MVTGQVTDFRSLFLPDVTALVAAPWFWCAVFLLSFGMPSVQGLLLSISEPGFWAGGRGTPSSVAGLGPVVPAPRCSALLPASPVVPCLPRGARVGLQWLWSLEFPHTVLWIPSWSVFCPEQDWAGGQHACGDLWLRGEGWLGAVSLWVLRGAPRLRAVSAGRTGWGAPRGGQEDDPLPWGLKGS